jgi:hypothetical protein
MRQSSEDAVANCHMSLEKRSMQVAFYHSADSDDYYIILLSTFRKKAQTFYHSADSDVPNTCKN